MAFTVVPLHNLYLPVGSRIPFGSKFVLQDVPEWLRNDTEFLKAEISRVDMAGALAARHALVAEYDAASIRHPDPEWHGKKQRFIQELRFESALLANLAIWIIQPSSVCLTVGFHALTRLDGGRTMDPPFLLDSQREGPLYCHPQDLGNPVEPKHVIKAAILFDALSTIPRKNPAWEALRAFWAGLTMAPPDLRYPYFWMGLEALFGAEDGREIGYKLAQRIAFFLADTPEIARDLFKKVKKCYEMRSKIVHGRWKDDPKIGDVMAVTESIARTVVRRMMEKPEMVQVFISKERDQFLEDWVFSRSTDPPPYPQPK
jgi:hypothetical protein